MRVWHYTIYSFVAGIINDREIVPTGMLTEHSDISGVWLSSNPLWEESVWKALRDIDTGEIIPEMPIDDLIEWGIIPVRIEIDPTDVAIYSWEDHKRITAMPKLYSESFEKTGIERDGNPKEWYVCYEGIPWKAWFDPIQIWTGTEWDDIETLFTKDQRKSNHHLLDKTIRRKSPSQ